MIGFDIPAVCDTESNLSRGLVGSGLGREIVKIAWTKASISAEARCLR